MSPKRIQRKRTKGYRLPPDAVYVGRPTVYGNPYRSGAPDGPRYEVESFRESLINAVERPWTQPVDIEFRVMAEGISALRGRDLACWCDLCPVHADGRPFDVECPDCPPCHADLLGRSANQ